MMLKFSSSCCDEVEDQNVYEEVKITEEFILQVTPLGLFACFVEVKVKVPAG